MTGVDVPEFADIRDVVKSVQILTHVEKLLGVLDEADAVYASFPKALKEQLRCESCGHDTDLISSAKGKIALAFAQLSPDVRAAVKTMLQEVHHHVSTWNVGDEYGGLGALDSNDLSVIQEMITFVQRTGSKSTRHLLTFLQGANEGEPGYVLVYAKGRESEVRHKYDLPEGVLGEFGLRRH